MGALLLMIGAFAGYIVAYHTYGKYIGKKIFQLSTKNIVPSVEFEDGVDFVPTKKEIIFGHHYTSIAGTGPIVGPAIGIIWGWIPAMLWIFFGSILMGAVHDFGALVISLRNQGKSLSDYTAKYVNPRTRFLFFVIVFFELWIVSAIFGLVIAIIFKMFPASVFPVWFQIPIAMTLGFLIYKKRKKHVLPSIVALILMYLTIVIGYYFQFEMPSVLGIPATGIWTIILLIYVFFASVLPVTSLLQPRDYINSFQLIAAMGLMAVGVITSMVLKGMDIVAPSMQMSPKDAPPLLPFLFITIACGAISGFHSLVSSGTTSKQIKTEKDALFIGYGSMLLEGVLATLVIIAVAAGIGMGYKGATGINAWDLHYSSWGAAKGLGSKITAFVEGAANMISTLGIPQFIGTTIMGVFVASFASTTLDSATRIQRYVITELFTSLKLKKLTNRYFITAIVVITALLLAFSSGADGNGALTLWPLFGAVNQTLAALALLVITIYLKEKGGLKWLISGIPAVFMIIMTSYASFSNEITYFKNGQILLSVIGIIILIIIVWITIESIIKFKQVTPKSESKNKPGWQMGGNEG